MRTTSLLLALATLGCRSPDDKGTPTPDVADSGAPDPGTDPSLAAGPTDAFAGVVRDGESGEAALSGGITAEGRAGDLVLWNDRVRFVVQGARPGHGIVHTAGGVLDADIVRTDGTLGRDTVEDVFLAFGLSRLFHADSVEVVSAGGPDTAAVVVARGTDVVWEYWEGMFERTTPLVADMDLDIVTTYTLEPGAWALDITTELTNPTEEAVTISLADGIFASGEDLVPWAPGSGHGGPETGPLEAAWFVGRTGEGAFGVYSTEDDLSVGALSELASELGIFFAEHAAFELAPGASHTVRRSLAVAPDVSTGEGARRSALGESLGTVSGSAVDSDGTPLPGVRVHLLDATTHAAGGIAITDTSGTFTAELPPGAWSAVPVASTTGEVVGLAAGAGRYGPFAAAPVNQRQLDVLAETGTASPVAFAAGHGQQGATSFELTADHTTELSLTLPAASGVEVRVRDADGTPLPALVELRWADTGRPGLELEPAVLDALDLDTGTRHAWGWTSTGTLFLPAPAGTFELHAGHSWRYTRQTVDAVDVTEGATTTVTITLDEVVALDGWLSMDSHLHASPSFDGALAMEDRLVGCATSGVALPVATDHDAMADYQGLATALGLDARMQVVPGLEVTTLLRGHFNLFPLEPRPLTEPNGGAVRWWDVPADTQEVFDRMHAAGGDRAVVQVNHPRSPGMFAFARFDPTTGVPGEPDKWSWDFALMELLNGGTSDFEELREDWFSLLDLGQVRVPTGVSDSHYRYIPCGMARTDVFLDTTDPRGVSTADLMDALAAGHVVVASGTTLRASLAGALPGDTVSGSGGALDVEVRAPEWIVPGTLQVLVDGVPVHEEVLDAAVDGLWYADSIELDLDTDAWVVVEVRGDTPMGDAWRNTTPYAVTNAFFVDVDGDGWQAPGLASIAARARATAPHADPRSPDPGAGELGR